MTAERITVPADLAGLRLDAVLAQVFPAHSRNRLKAWLDAGHIEVDGERVEGKVRLEGGEVITARFPADETAVGAIAQDIGLDILFEDEHLIIVNKPAGLVVHPGAGNREGTLLNALLHHAPELAGVARAGIVHRLDKDTSGVMMVARTVAAQTHLVRQLQRHLAAREYLALVHGVARPTGTVEGAIGRDPRHRTRMAVVVTGGKAAVTHFRARETFAGPAMRGQNLTLVECRLETGRTHQIRVHMASIRHPLVGDPTYGRRGDRLFPRQALHAWRLALTHPASGAKVQFTAPMAPDLRALLRSLRQRCAPRPSTQWGDGDEDFDGDVESIYVRD